MKLEVPPEAYFTLSSVVIQRVLLWETQKKGGPLIRKLRDYGKELLLQFCNLHLQLKWKEEEEEEVKHEETNRLISTTYMNTSTFWYMVTPLSPCVVYI